MTGELEGGSGGGVQNTAQRNEGILEKRGDPEAWGIEGAHHVSDDGSRRRWHPEVTSEEMAADRSLTGTEGIAGLQAEWPEGAP